MNANARHAVQRFIDNGFLPIHAFAVIGHDYQESLLKPAIVGDKMLKDAAHGIGQWRGSRFKNLQDFASGRGKPWQDLDVQIDFQIAEIRGEVGTEGGRGKKLLATATLEEAVAAAMGLFRPKGYTSKNPKAGHGWANRLRNAQTLASEYGPPAPPAAAPVAVPLPPTAVSTLILPAAAPAVAQALRALIPPMIQMGDQGPAVQALQLALALLGYRLKGTGYFGPATDVAVRDYQRTRGLTPDGQVGALTAAALDARKPAIASALPVDDKPLWLIYALSTLGTKEKPGAGSNPTIMEWAKKEGGAIAKAFTADFIAWCALFANMTLTKAGLPGTETLWALDFHSNKWPNAILGGPAVGAFMPMKRDGGGHIAIVVGRTKDGALAGIGGNQSDAVTIAGFPKTRPVSFRWPAGVSLPRAVGFNYLPIVDTAGRSIKES